MKTFLSIIILLSAFSSQSQNIVMPYGEYMDTVFVPSKNGSKYFPNYYYSVNGKYPQSSPTLLKKVNLFLEKKPKYTGSGYITLRFVVNYDGKTSYYRVMQTDEKYQETHFDKRFVQDLYDFTQSLEPWTKCFHPETKEPLNYKAFISFKIKDGKVINIIP
jgi:hypothetical protein